MPDVSRRDFCCGVAMTAAAACACRAQGQVATPAAAPSKPARDSPAVQAWMKDLAQRGEPLVYRGADLAEIALPLGGVGTGYVAIGGRGQFCEWQIFNNVNKEAKLPESFLAVRVKGAGEPVARLLQLDPIGGLPVVQDIEFRGDYPFAQLTYHDDALPVEVKLEAWNPLIPLNEEESGVPGCLLTLSATNRGAAACEVSFLASLQNAVGWSGYGGYQGNKHAAFGGNRAAAKEAGGLRVVDMGVVAGQRPRLAERVRVFSLDHDDEMRLVENLAKGGPGWNNEIPNGNALGGNYDVVWLDRLPGNVTDVSLSNLLDAARFGATLLVTGTERGLMAKAAFANQLLASEAGGKVDEVVFADFEAGYEGWTLEGEAFGDAPAKGTLPGQNPVSGFKGQGLVNTFLGGDGPVGKATSKPFTIEKRFIRFLIGGGSHAGRTCMNLLVDGKVVRTATGRSDEHLEPHSWDVRDQRGKEARLEIVDSDSGGWGHINIDQITFGDTPAVELTPETAQALSDALPLAFDTAERIADPVTAEKLADNAPPSLKDSPVRAWLKLGGVQVKPGAQVLASAPDGSPLLVARRYGKGRLLVFCGDAESGSPRWSEQGRLLGELLALAGKTTYTSGTGIYPESPFYGTLALATSAADATSQAAWSDLAALWADFAADGRLDPVAEGAPTAAGETRSAAIAAPLTLAPGETKSVTFYLAWHFPNHYRRFWGPPYEIYCGNAYKKRFADAAAVAAWLHANHARLEKSTRAFHDALYDSTLPYWLVDAVSSQACIMRSQTTIWFEDDFFGGYEGCGGGEGCCPMNCTHVWNYAQSMAALFPGLERRVRRDDLGPQMWPDGVVGHRHNYPRTPGRAAAGEATDGQCSAILKTYREHRRSADDSFLKEVWPGCKRALLYLLDKRDSDGDGILDGSQLHTYDVAMTGVSMFIQSLWLAALRAGEEMAQLVGDDAMAARCRSTYEKAGPALDQMLWDGEYWLQKYNAAGDTRWQHGPGCLADQVMGQWWAQMLDLGWILPRERVKQALDAVVRYNFRDSFAGFVQQPRRFAFDDEKGLLCCTWPKGGRPAEPILYCDEVWTGVEYQVAGHAIFEGLTETGLAIARAARERYRGHNRNPWNEIECGNNYARAMSSWSLLLAAQGFIYDGPAGRIGFLPNLGPDDHRSLFTAAEGWGRYATRLNGAVREHRLEVTEGKLRVTTLVLLPGDAAKVQVQVDGKAVQASAQIVPGNGRERLSVTLQAPLDLAAGAVVTVRVG